MDKPDVETGQKLPDYLKPVVLTMALLFAAGVVLIVVGLWMP